LCGAGGARHETLYILNARGLCNLPVETRRVLGCDICNIDHEVSDLTIKIGSLEVPFLTIPTINIHVGRYYTHGAILANELG
jgi:hypothetical protein